MNEESVLAILSNDLNSRGWLSFVDSKRYSPDLVETVNSLNNCRVNNTISISRKIPDIIGFTNQDRIFAIEAKGESGLAKGIGQAAHYRQGVHKSYLAADAEEILEYKETILSCGVGIISVREEGIAEWIEPAPNISGTDITRTRRALAIKTNDYQSDQDSFASVTHPIHAILPVLAINRYGSLDAEVSKDECQKLIIQHEENYKTAVGSQTAPHTITLSLSLGLLKKRHGSEAKLVVTDIGRMGYSLIKGITENQPVGSLGLDTSQIDDEDDLVFKYHKHLRSPVRKRLYQRDGQLTAYLRDRYLSIPDVRLLIHVLSLQDTSETELSEILAEIAFEAPDAFINLFCEDGMEGKFRDRIEDTSIETDDESFRQFLLDNASPDALYNFIHQMRHIGFLTVDTDSVHQDIQPDIGEFYWRWDPELIGTIRHRQI